MPIAALVLGLVGLILSLVPCLGMYALPLTILAIIFAVLGMKKETGKGMSIAGLVCGVIGTLIASWWLYGFVTVRNEINDPNSNLNKGVQQLDQEFQEGMTKPEQENLKSTTPDVE